MWRAVRNAAALFFLCAVGGMLSTNLSLIRAGAAAAAPSAQPDSPPSASSKSACLHCHAPFDKLVARPGCSAGLKPERDELPVSPQLLQAVLGGACGMAVPAVNDAHELERKMGPDEFTSRPPAMFLEPPRQIVRRPDVDVAVAAPQGVYAPPLIVLFHSDRCPGSLPYFLNRFS